MPETYTLPVVTDKISTNICTLRLTDPQNALQTWIYSFYVSPDQLIIETPSRVAVYQSIGGASYIDHLGAGITSVTLRGSTGFRTGKSNQLGMGALQASLLRDIVNKYNNFCRLGFSSKTLLTLQLSFADDPSFGEWNVTIRNFNISRSVQQPLIFQYTLDLACLTANLQDTGRPNVETLATVSVPTDVQPEKVIITPEGGPAETVSVTTVTVTDDPEKSSVKSPVVKVIPGQPPVKSPEQPAAVVQEIIPPESFPYTIPGYFPGLTKIVNNIRYAILEGSVKHEFSYVYESYSDNIIQTSNRHVFYFAIPANMGPNSTLIMVASPILLEDVRAPWVTQASIQPSGVAGNHTRNLIKISSNTSPINQEVWVLNNPETGKCRFEVSLNASSPLFVNIAIFSNVNQSAETPIIIGEFDDYSKNASTTSRRSIDMIKLSTGDAVVAICTGQLTSSQASPADGLQRLSVASRDDIRTAMSLVQQSLANSFFNNYTQSCFIKYLTDDNTSSVAVEFSPAPRNTLAAAWWRFFYIGIQSIKTAPAGIGAIHSAKTNLASIPPRTIDEILNVFWNIGTGVNARKGTGGGATPFQYENSLQELVDLNPDLNISDVNAILQEGKIINIPVKYKKNMIG